MTTNHFLMCIRTTIPSPQLSALFAEFPRIRVFSPALNSRAFHCGSIRAAVHQIEIQTIVSQIERFFRQNLDDRGSTD
jgi:predicted protein tyrosine phosphatase